jgi:hypothetical protein
VSRPAEGEAIVQHAVSALRLDKFWSFESRLRTERPALTSTDGRCEPSKADAVDQVTVREGLMLIREARGSCEGPGMLTEGKKLSEVTQQRT